MCHISIPCNPGQETAYTSSQAGRRGRFDVFDESSYLLAGCATRRVVALHRTTCIKLLNASALELCSDEIESAQQLVADECEDEWLSRWGKSTLADLLPWESGAVIVATPLLRRESVGVVSQSSIFLSCSLHKKSRNGSMCDRLKLLADEKLANSWRRVLTAKNEKPSSVMQDI